MSSFAKHANNTPRETQKCNCMSEKQIDDKINIVYHKCMEENKVDVKINAANEDIFQFIEKRVNDSYEKCRKKMEELRKQNGEIVKSLEIINENTKKQDDQIKKTVKKRVAPLILAEGFNRKSVHEPTESSQQKFVYMDTLNKVG